jgi:hypothetical protein
MLDPQRLNGSAYRAEEIEHAIAALPAGWRNEDSDALAPFEEYWKGRLGPGTAALIGPSSAGKTTLLCRLGYGLATGQPVFDAPVISPMGVAHVMGESVGDIPRRYAALRYHTGDNRRWPIAWTANKANLFEKRERRALITKLRELDAYFQAEFEVPLKAVFFDTATTNWHFDDENSNGQWARLTIGLEEFADAVEGVALYAHHPPKSGTGERGGGAARAGLGYILTASCDRDDRTGKVENRQLAVTKHRNGETGPISGFELQQVALGIIDAFGDQVTSVVAEPCEAPDTDASARAPTANNAKFDRAFEDALREHGKPHRVMTDGPHVEAVEVSHVKAAFKRRYATGETDAKTAGSAFRQAWRRELLQNAPRRGYATEATNTVELIWRTS